MSASVQVFGRRQQRSNHALRRPAFRAVALLDHLVGAREQHWRHVEAERLGSLPVDDQLVLGWRLHRQVDRLLPLEDAVDVAGRSAELVELIIPVGDEAAVVNKVARKVDRRQFVPGCKHDDQTATRSSARDR